MLPKNKQKKDKNYQYLTLQWDLENIYYKLKVQPENTFNSTTYQEKDDSSWKIATDIVDLKQIVGPCNKYQFRCSMSN